MIVPCDFYIKVYLPSIKAKVAEILYRQYNKKQEEIAKLLGITQAATSKYISRKLSKKISEIMNRNLIEEIARDISKSLVEKNYAQIPFSKEVCKLCGGCKL
ncbi:MAG: hypothetical protein QXX30_03250 [Candidatus Aenigmatarchaeota archaeon]